MKFLLTGCTGQLGWELERRLATAGDLVACDRSTMDLSQSANLAAIVRAHRPDVIVNAAGYTAVDRAQSEPDLALRINAEAVEVLALEARRAGALLVHFSTDYVFDGTGVSPYGETDPTGPLGVYGQSKLAGEEAIRAAGARHLILRTSWLYSSRRHNFLLTMLRLARERSELRVVDDQTGAPSWSRDVAAAVLAALTLPSPLEGLFHVSAAGQTTWCGFARRILQIAGLATPVRAIETVQYPTPARRPHYSVLDSAAFSQATGFRIGSWDSRLAACMQEAGLSAARA